MNGLEIFGIVILSIVGVVLAYLICHGLLILFLALIVDMKKDYARTSKFYERFTNYSVWLILKLINVKVVVNGKEKIPENSRFLFVANHRSNFDPVIARAMLGKYDLNFISKPQNFDLPIVKRFLHRMKFLAIDRDNPRSSLKTLNKAIEYIKNDQVGFEEGMRSAIGMNMGQLLSIPFVVIGIVLVIVGLLNKPQHIAWVEAAKAAEAKPKAKKVAPPKAKK